MNIIKLEGLTFPWYVKQWQITDSAAGGGGTRACTLYLVLFCSVNRKRTACAIGKMGLKHSSSYRFTKPHCVGCRYFWAYINRGERDNGKCDEMPVEESIEIAMNAAAKMCNMCLCLGSDTVLQLFSNRERKQVWNCCPTGNESCTCVVFFQYVVCVDECKTLHAKWRASENMMLRRTGEPKKVKANPGGRAS
jgi:hypothetical protein